MPSFAFRSLLLALIIALNARGQSDKIRAVENNLSEVRVLVFEDSIVPTYHILDRMEFYKVPSVSIAVIHQGRIAWTKTYGYADVATKRPANPNTMYQVASITKSVTGTGIMKLAQQNTLSLSADIRTYLETWTLPDNEISRGKTITLANLLSHTAGLSVHGFIGYPVGDSIPTINQVLNGERPANNEPVIPRYPIGTHFEYSGGGYTVIRKILDDAVSPQFDSLMQSLLLQPIRMRHSSFSQPLSPKFSDYAYGHDQDMRPLKGHYYIYPELAAGGLWSTAGDIARFVTAVQQSLKGSPGAMMPKAAAEAMLTPVLNNYAMGFAIEDIGGEKYFRHEGENYGYNAMYYGSFTTGVGVVILTNAYPNNGKPFIRELLNSVAVAYDWKDFYRPVKKKLVYVPDSVLELYVGEYLSENPQMTITITKKDHALELNARRPEKMYATKTNTFFLASSPHDQCVFSSSRSDGLIDVFEVIQNGQTIIRASRRTPAPHQPDR